MISSYVFYQHEYFLRGVALTLGKRVSSAFLDGKAIFTEKLDELRQNLTDNFV